MTTPDYRALCKELLLFGEQAISEREGIWPRCDHNNYDLLIRARAALAAEPVPVPEGPTDQEIEALHHAVFFSRLQGPSPNTSCEVDLVRAALAFWGQP
jgi:hypothetical protein